MTWVAPDIDRASPPNTGPERAMLEGWLEFHRQTLLGKCSGLSAEQLCRASVEPSMMSLLGLVRHMAEVERSWFRRRVAGEQIDFLYCSDEHPDGDFEVQNAEPERDFEVFGRELELAREVAAGRSLDSTFIHGRTQEEMSLRWVYVHMIEEYARHNGHADLIRERIDGATGD